MPIRAVLPARIQEDFLGKTQKGFIFRPFFGTLKPNRAVVDGKVVVMRGRSAGLRMTPKGAVKTERQSFRFGLDTAD